MRRLRVGVGERGGLVGAVIKDRHGSAIGACAAGLDAPARMAQFRAQGGGVSTFRQWLWVSTMLLALAALPVARSRGRIFQALE